VFCCLSAYSLTCLAVPAFNNNYNNVVCFVPFVMFIVYFCFVFPCPVISSFGLIVLLCRLLYVRVFIVSIATSFVGVVLFTSRSVIAHLSFVLTVLFIVHYPSQPR